MGQSNEEEINKRGVARDPVCGMGVFLEAAQEARLYEDHNGVRYVFCSLACYQVFQMDPQRFLNQEKTAIKTGRCDLCSKIIREDDEVSRLNIRGKAYQFCCPTCASVYSSKIKTDFLKVSEQPVDKIERLKSSGIFQWLEDAVRQNASDIFLSVGELPTLKIYGTFKQLDNVALKSEQLSQIIHALLPERNLSQFLENGEADIGLGVEGLSRFRINVFREQKGDAVAIRPLPYEIPTLEELKLPDVFQDISRLRRGLVLITGPAGSGKSTTLAALINTINQREEKHIITIEDPIEYIIPSKRSLIHQREVGIHTLSFSDGLRNCLRENPDIIVVGELRDLESISLAIRAAETGHLVFGTLHSGTAIQALTRLLDVFNGERQAQIRIQLAQSLQAICAQRLLKRRDMSDIIVATEVLIATLAVRTIIRTNRLSELHGYIEMGRYEQMHSFKESIQALIDAGVVDTDALREAEDSPIPRLPYPQKPPRRFGR